MTDTLFADISEYQVPVDDSYPYRVLSIRATDGDYVDHNFAPNYAWMRNALDSGKLVFGIVYTYVRPATWQDNANAVRSLIDNNGGLRPRVVLMLDVEHDNINAAVDQSGQINGLFQNFVDYCGGNVARVIGYGNIYDLDDMWPNKPRGIRLIIASYGSNPDYPGKIAHQYTDGQVGADPANGLPDGAPPFGQCDMNSADGLDPYQFAAACGITTPAPIPARRTPGIEALARLARAPRRTIPRHRQRRLTTTEKNADRHDPANLIQGEADSASGEGQRRRTV
jgi:hypothetical protein